MKALQFDFSIPRYLFVKTVGRWIPSIHWHSSLSCLRYRQTEAPEIPSPKWVKVKVKYGGICGSDMNLIHLNDSPSISPYASYPFTIGHEVVGEISEVGTDVVGLKKGDRVVVDPILSCLTRGIEPLCSACERGDYSLCERMTEGDLAPGLLIGACKDTGGSWGSYLVAHESQIFKLPDEVNDLNGVMVEPFSCAIHSVLKNPPKPKDNVLVIGAGVIGICVVAALKALDFDCHITVLAKHPFQAELAKKYGADHTIKLSKREHYYDEIAQLYGAKRLKPLMGPPVLSGGADVVIDCVGKKQSMDDALRLARSNGRVIMLGLASIVDKLDWTTVWLNELEVKGCFAYGTEEYKGKKMRTLHIAIQLMKEKKVDLEPLITHRFPLEKYKEAFVTATKKGKDSAIKIVLEP